MHTDFPDKTNFKKPGTCLVYVTQNFTAKRINLHSYIWSISLKLSTYHVPYMLYNQCLHRNTSNY